MLCYTGTTCSNTFGSSDIATASTCTANEHIQDLEYKARDTSFQCQLVSSQKQRPESNHIWLGLKVKTMKTMHKHVHVTSNSRIQQYLPNHRWSDPSSLPSLGSCLHGSPSVRPSTCSRPLRRRSSSSGMPFAEHSFGQAPSGSCCQAPFGICEQPSKNNPSSCVEWLNAWSKSAAPSAPWVPLTKHLQCFVSIDPSKRSLTQR